MKTGSRVAMIAPSSPAIPEKLAAGVEVVRSMGLEPIVYPSCGATPPERGYLASESDEVKARDIHRAFADDEVDGVICVRGGSGAGRLLRLLDADLISRHPKPFIGYSDITILHCFIARECGFVTFHAPMPTTDDLSDGGANRASLLRALTDPSPIGATRGLDVIAPGRASGTLTGGNLALLCTTIGTRAQVETRGRIVFIEDVDEEPYSVDRMISHMINAGLLVDAAGIVVGSFTKCDPPETSASRTVETVLRDLLPPLGVPVLSGLDVGHGATNLTLPLGVEASIDTDQRTFTITSSALI